jgi:hypothetical protein
MTVDEIAERDYHEDVIESVKNGIGQLAKIGDASLKVLREKRLYRATHDSFEDYCKERLGITRQYANLRLAFNAVLGDLETRVSKSLPETEKQARPLSALPNADLKADAWTKAQTDTGKDQPSAREVDAAVQSLKADLAAALERADAAEGRSEAYRQQDNAKLKLLREKEQLIETAQAESATLRRTLAAEAKKMANAQVQELRSQVDSAQIDRAEADLKLKKMRKDMAEQVADGITKGLQARQDEVTRTELQLQAVQGRIAVLNVRLDAFTDQDRAVTHYTEITRDIRSAMDALSLHLTRAFDPDYAKFLPEPFVAVFERLAQELAQGADSVRAVLGQIDIRQLEGAVHE